jgi:serine/threonine-protein kinase
VVGSSTATEPATASTAIATTKLAAPADKTRATYAAHLPNGAGTLYLALRDGTAVAYLCDGKKLEAWFHGTAASGKFKLSGKKAGTTLAGSFTPTAASGQATVAGKTMSFSLPQVHKPSGLYRAAAKVRNAEVKGGWIVLPDRTQVGVVTVGDVPQPAPELNLGSLTATVDGTAVPATEIDIDSGTGF